jgi:hypothetical protein
MQQKHNTDLPADKLETFDEILRQAGAALPHINPQLADQSDPSIELQNVAGKAISNFWSLFEKVRSDSMPNPVLGYLNGINKIFAREKDSFEDEFKNYRDPQRLLERIQMYMLQALCGVLDYWIEEHEKIGPKKADFVTAESQMAYDRMKTLIEQNNARRAEDVRGFLLPGIDTSLGSILAHVGVIAPLFLSTFDSEIKRDIYRDLILQVMKLHTQLSNGGFDFFVVLANVAADYLPELQSTSFNPDHFELSKHNESYKLSPRSKLLKVLRNVVVTQTANKEDSQGIKTISGCPARHAKGVSFASSGKSVVQEFEDWIVSVLEDYYLPTFKN